MEKQKPEYFLFFLRLKKIKVCDFLRKNIGFYSEYTNNDNFG